MVFFNTALPPPAVFDYGNNLCRFATAYEGKYSDSIAEAYVFPSSNYLNDIAWAAAVSSLHGPVLLSLIVVTPCAGLQQHTRASTATPSLRRMSTRHPTISMTLPGLLPGYTRELASNSS